MNLESNRAIFGAAEVYSNVFDMVKWINNFRTAEIDLIPFGIFDGPGEMLIWPKSGNRMNMTGFREVFHHAKPTEVTPGVMLPVVPLELLPVAGRSATTDDQAR